MVRIEKPPKEMGAIIASAKILNNSELVTFKELLMANSKMVDTLDQLVIQKGVFTEEEFYAKLKEVDRQNQAGKRTGL